MPDSTLRPASDLRDDQGDHLAIITYSDGAIRRVPVAAGQTVLEAAEQQGVPIVSACHSGICGTCVGRRVSGRLSYDGSIGLSQAEKDAGRFLACQAVLETECEIAFDYPLDDNAASMVSGLARLCEIRRLGPGVALITLDTTDFAVEIDYRPGQFAQLRVPGSQAWRSYSFASAASDGGRVQFLVRLLPSGMMSDYLRERAEVGDLIELRGPKGGFSLREGDQAIVLLAGGTGLSATLAIAEQLCLRGHPSPVLLCYGVKSGRDLALLDRLGDLAARHPGFIWRGIVEEPAAGWDGPTGVVTDLLSADDFNGAPTEVYVCGPPTMVEASRAWLDRQGFANLNFYYEQFGPSAARSREPAARADSLKIDLDDMRRAGEGTAIVVGGSIAGIAAAKMLAEHYRRVVVLEKDADQRKYEGRAGAAQGWHLHHLLIAGQRMVETIFPGVVDDMVAAGAFRVDMGEQYRIFLAGAWKRVIHSGIDIVCAGRPLLEWCLRRRLDSEPKVEFCYGRELADIIFDTSSDTVVGVVTGTASDPQVLAAAFVVDASGKNSPLPGLLERWGYPAPELDTDDINCFYSTMFHRVPAERVWSDKVMVINYPYRPHEKYYAAQYYTDNRRTVLSTTLVGYDCYDPPRNAQEFREFARRMPDPRIGDELDGLEPISPVHNFRYPAMQRYSYQHISRLPGGIVALGDALASADPVSGAGMTKAFLEVDMLRKLMRGGADMRDARTARAFYRQAGRLSDMIWDVIREQNLRFDWIRDAAAKRGRFSAARNWYVDRLMEAMHDSPALYRRYLAVSHFVEPPTSLMRVDVIARVLGRWAATKLAGRSTLIERKYGATAGPRT